MALGDGSATPRAKVEKKIKKKKRRRVFVLGSHENGSTTPCQNWVLNASYITSNTLALVNKLSTTGLESLTDP
jgi:hypothetical protein